MSDAEQMVAADSATSNSKFAPGRGLDVGTANWVSSVQDHDGNVTIKIQRNAFIDVNADDYTKSMLTKLNVQYVVIDGRMIVVGDPAFELANILNKETRRPMKDGVISPSETAAMPIEKILLANLLGEPNYTKENCYFSIPADPIDADFTQQMDRGVVDRACQRLGQRQGPEEFSAIILGFEDEARREVFVDDRTIVKNRRRREAVRERGRVDDRLERGARLPPRLDRPIELAPREVVAADHGDDVAGVEFEGEQAALGIRDLVEGGGQRRVAPAFWIRASQPEECDVAGAEDIGQRFDAAAVQAIVLGGMCPRGGLERQAGLDAATEGDPRALGFVVDAEDQALARLVEETRVACGSTRRVEPAPTSSLLPASKVTWAAIVPSPMCRSPPLRSIMASSMKTTSRPRVSCEPVSN